MIFKAVKGTQSWPSFLQEKIIRRYHSGSMITQEGTPVGFIYLLRSGVVKISVENREGMRIVLWVVSSHGKPCDILDKSSLVRQSHSYTCEALSLCEIYCLPKATFNWLMQQEAGLAREVLLELSSEVEGFVNKIRSESGLGARHRLAEILLQLHSIQTENAEKTQPLILDLSRQELASLLNVARETLTRLLAEFSKRGIIKISGNRIIILKKAQLSMIGTHTENEN